MGLRFGSDAWAMILVFDGKTAPFIAKMCQTWMILLAMSFLLFSFERLLNFTSLFDFVSSKLTPRSFNKGCSFLFKNSLKLRLLCLMASLVTGSSQKEFKAGFMVISLISFIENENWSCPLAFLFSNHLQKVVFLLSSLLFLQVSALVLFYCGVTSLLSLLPQEMMERSMPLCSACILLVRSLFLRSGSSSKGWLGLSLLLLMLEVAETLLSLIPSPYLSCRLNLILSACVLFVCGWMMLRFFEKDILLGMTDASSSSSPEITELGSYENAMMEESEACLLRFDLLIEFSYALGHITDINFILYKPLK